MRARKLLDYVITFTIISFLASYFYKTYNRPKKTLPLIKITKANDILKYRTQVSSDILNITATSSACTLFLKTSAEFAMNEYANEFIDHHVDGILKTCSGAFPDALQESINEAILKCKSSSREKITSECYGALISAKSKSIATIIKPNIEFKELDATILIHLLFDAFNSNTIFEDPKKSLELVNTLLEKEPNYLGGYKVKLLILSMSELNKEERYKDLFDDTLDEALRLKNDDRELLELALTQKDYNSLKEDSLLHPKEWLYDYYMAKNIYKEGKGDYQKTLGLIEASLKKDPANGRLKQVLDNLKGSDETKRKHPFSISVGFSLDDL